MSCRKTNGSLYFTALYINANARRCIMHPQRWLKLGVFSSHLSRGSLSRYARHNLDVFHFKTQKNLPKESTLPASEVMRI
uniref:Uncharacterized protein n=1 Tax=Trichogramma kaykai TaxID=54128 RepID=A0ABD2WFF3_9HYME